MKAADSMHGWANSVYRFSCAFIHLSKLHGYDGCNPLGGLEAGERQEILSHMRSYHGGPRSDEPSLQELVEYVPAIFKKVRDNLGCYLSYLRRGEIGLVM